MADAESYDLVILGAGPGGYSAALRAARRGARVALVDGKQIGGVCLHSGCIPTKALLASADLHRLAQHAGDFALDMTVSSPSLPRLIERQQKIVAAITKSLDFLLQKAGVCIVPGRGRLLGNKQVAVGDRILIAPKLIIATGSRPASLAGFETYPDGSIETGGRRILNSDQILRLDRIPARLAIVGGGYIGCEFASFFAALGSKVAIYEMTDQLLPGLDSDIASALARSFSKQGIEIKTSTRLASAADLSDADVVLVAVGRLPNTDTFDRESENLALDDRGRFLRVDDHLRTCAAGIYAVGDITGAPMLAHVGLAQATVAVQNILGGDAHSLRYDVVPACVFTQPEIATVGLTEAQARARGREIKIGKFPFAALGKAAAVGETEGFVKLIADAETGKLLGGHILGGAASEQIGVLAMAIQHGITAGQITELITAHPTFNEAITEAAEAIATGQPLHLARPLR